MNRSVSVMVLVALPLFTVAPTMGQAASQPSDAASSGFASFAALQDSFAAKTRKAQQAIEAERLVSLDAYLKKAPAGEKQQVLVAMIQSATILENHDRVISLSDDYLKDSPTGQEAWSVRQVRFVSMIASNKLDLAKKEWDTLSEKVDMDAWQQVFDSAMLIADAMLEAGRTKDVADFYKALRGKFSFVSNIGQVLDPRDAAVKWLGKAAPALEGQDLDGKPVDLSQYKGKVVLIDFWATWCQPCVMAMPELLDTYKTHHAAGLEIIGVSLDQNKDALTQFLKAKQLPWRITFDGKAWGGTNARKYEVSAIPATFLIDRDGKIAIVGTPSKGFGPAIKRLLQPSAKK